MRGAFILKKCCSRWSGVAVSVVAFGAAASASVAVSAAASAGSAALVSLDLEALSAPLLRLW